MTQVIELNKSELQTVDKINACSGRLMKSYVERDDVITTLWEAVLSKMHVMLIGTPGTAKSALLMDFVKSFKQMSYFEIQVMQSTTPEEMFGHLSIKQLKDNDKFIRITDGKLPDVHLAYLDEVYHCSSGLLQGLNSILNERTFQGKEVPLIIAVGATNFVPDDEQGLIAFHDRWEYRMIVKDIQTSEDFVKMLEAPDYTIAEDEKISLEELEALQRKVQEVDISNIFKPLNRLRDALKADGMEFSARRWKWSLNAIKARSILDKRMVAEDMDLFCLINILWEEEDQIPIIYGQISKIIDPIIDQLKVLLVQAKDISEKLKPLSAQNAEENLEISEGMKQLSVIEKKIKQILAKKGIHPRVRNMIEIVAKNVSEIRQKIIQNKFEE